MGFFFVNGMFTGNFFLIGHPGKHAELKHTKLHTGLVLYLLLERLGKLGKALIGHHMEDVDVLVLDAFTVLVDAQTQATPDFLAAGKGGFLFDQGTDLEHVGIVPAFPQGRVGEDKPQGTVKAEQPLFVPHDGVIGVVIGLSVSLGVFETALFVLREVAVVYLADISGEAGLQGGIFGLCHQLLIALLKHLGIDSRCAVLVAVLVHLVDEKQR